MLMPWCYFDNFFLNLKSVQMKSFQKLQAAIYFVHNFLSQEFGKDSVVWFISDLCGLARAPESGGVPFRVTFTHKSAT